jgi:tRNA dimethylallyltransferase
VVLLLRGKTALGIELAKKLNGEIISADSMQIYRHMDIGTAKPSLEEMQNIPHHLIDIVNPDAEFNVSKYKELAIQKIDEILSKNKVPIIVGGTGLYINTLVNGVEFSEIEKDEEYTKSLEMISLKENGVDVLYDMLKKVDPESASTIEKNNVRRVIRALEIYKVTGQKKSTLDRESQKETPYEYLVFGINLDREVLYDRINRRVDKMIEQGLVDEVKNLREKYSFSKTAIQGLGYKEVIEYLDNQISREEMIEKIKMESRRYAKRQMTWFKKTKGIVWIDGNELDTIVSAFKRHIE